MAKATMSRRGFLKTAAATGAVAAATGAFASNFTKLDPAVAAEQDEEIVIHTSCRACIIDCGAMVTVRNGRVVRIEGDPADPMNHGRMCAKGLAGIQALYNPNRLKYPMRRVGERGQNQWERISWKEAIDQIADAMMELYEKDDPMQLLLSCGGGGNPTRIMAPPRFLNAFGGGNFFEPGCAQCYLPRANAFPVVNGMNDTSIADAAVLEIFFNNSKSCVLWGTDPSQSNVASGGRALTQLRKSGCKTVVIDPRLTPDAAKADVWLPIRPGTDVALALSWIRYIMDQKIYDEEFVMKWTNLPYLINEETKLTYRADELGLGSHDDYVVWDAKTNAPAAMPFPWDDNLEPVLDGEFEVNGKKSRTAYRALWEAVEEYTLDKAAEICWLDADRIEEAINTYAEGAPAAGISLGVPTDQYVAASDGPMAIAIIDILMGCINRPGSWVQKRPSGPAGVAQPWDNNGFNELVPTLCVPAEQQAAKLGYIEHKGLEHWHASHIPTILEAVRTGKPYRPKIWVDFSGNKPIMMGNAAGFIQDMRDNIELAVHCFMYPTASSVEMADILLPTSEWLENSYIAYRMNTLVVRQPCTHLFESVDNHMIYGWLAKALADRGHENCQLTFQDPFPDPNFGGYWKNLDEFQAWLADQADRKVLHKGLSWKELCEQAPIEFMPMDEWQNNYEQFAVIDEETGKPKGFNTSSKKCEPYAEGFTVMGRTGGRFGADHNGNVQPPASADYEPLPHFEEPAESPLTDTEYPYVLTSGRVPMFHHGTLRNVPWLREIYPVPQCWMNPKTAAEVGVEEGDWVKIESRRGETHGKVLVTEGIAPGVVAQERFWNPELLNSEDPSQAWKAMNVNVLTKNDPPYNNVYGSYTLRGFTVKISKSEKPAGVWEEPEEFTPWLPEYSDYTGGGYAVYDAGEANYA
ncbi:molybdopterin-dependent oxidoreductase [uncultured Adlercreutzia sp.]|uniref:molybdopterin-containing oxidoreductase family protein n=5 Tax=uncultured Adlercreutzia sp. TaxID=875803 RepID=UPI00272DE1EA|nr:molybdopterin-dependent oxidoreductase [uncultured Adlercreutzia sp.]